MTFLEFVCHRLYGAPVSGSCWRCPFCDSSSPSFSVRPPKEGFAVKFRCFSCDTWGDEYDLLALAYPGEDFPRRRVRVDRWKKDYDAERPVDADSDVLSSGDLGESRKHVDDPESVAEAWDSFEHELEENETSEAFAACILNTAKAYCDKAGVSLGSFVDYRENFVQWKIKYEQKHLAECDNPECSDAVCRRGRGLRPLSCAELREKKVTKKTTTKKTAKKPKKKKKGV